MQHFNEDNRHRTNARTLVQGIGQTFTRFWYLYLLFLLVCLSMAFVVNRNTEPVFLVRTTVLIKENRNIAHNPQFLLYGEGQEMKGEKANISEEIALLESVQFIRRIIDSMKLRVGYYAEGSFRREELYENPPFNISFPEEKPSTQLLGRSYQLVFLDAKKFFIQEIQKNGKKGSRKEGQIGNQLNNFIVQATPEFVPRRDIGRKFEFTVFDPEALVSSFRNGLNIKTNGTDATLIQIFFATPVPALGIDFLNEFTSQYLNYKYEEKIRALSQSLSFINNQIDLISGSLGTSETDLEKFKAANNYSDASRMTDWSMSEISDLERQNAGLVLKDRYYNSLLSALQVPGQAKIVQAGSVGIKDDATDQLINELERLHLERQQFVSQGLNKNPMNLEVESKISELKQKLRGNVNVILSNNRTEMNIVGSSMGKQKSIINRLPRSERKFVDISRSNNLNEQIFLFLSQKRLEAGIMKAATTVENEVIEKALLDSAIPLRPKKRNNYALAFALGLIIPSVLIYVKGLFKRKVSTETDVSAILHMPSLGAVLINQDKKELFISPDSRTAFSESIRILRTRLVGLPGHFPKVFLVSSMDRGEGKTFCSVNIATSLALLRKKTILVNLDLRAENSIFPQQEKGLGAGAFLDEIIHVSDIICTTSQPFLDYIPAGECPLHCAELFREDKIAELLSFLKSRYDYIIIDTSPLGKIADALVVARMSTLNLFVIRADYSSLEQIRALEKLYEEGSLLNAAWIYNGKHLAKKDRNNFYYRPASRSRSQKQLSS